MTEPLKTYRFAFTHFVDVTERNESNARVLAYNEVVGDVGSGLLDITYFDSITHTPVDDIRQEIISGTASAEDYRTQIEIIQGVVEDVLENFNFSDRWIDDFNEAVDKRIYNYDLTDKIVNTIDSMEFHHMITNMVRQLVIRQLHAQNGHSTGMCD